MSITKKEVEYIADLAKLELTEEEKEQFTHQLNDILNYMQKLDELNTDDVEPLSNPAELTNVFRDDEVKESISREDALKNAPDTDGEFFKVPKVIRNKE